MNTCGLQITRQGPEGYKSGFAASEKYFSRLATSGLRSLTIYLLNIESGSPKVVRFASRQICITHGLFIVAWVGYCSCPPATFSPYVIQNARLHRPSTSG